MQRAALLRPRTTFPCKEPDAESAARSSSLTSVSAPLMTLLMNKRNYCPRLLDICRQLVEVQVGQVGQDPACLLQDKSLFLD